MFTFNTQNPLSLRIIPQISFFIYLATVNNFKDIIMTKQYFNIFLLGFLLMGTSFTQAKKK